MAHTLSNEDFKSPEAHSEGRESLGNGEGEFARGQSWIRVADVTSWDCR